MLSIVSQNKMNVVNYNTFSVLFIYEGTRKFSIRIRHGEDNIDLGAYTSEEKAKTVLKQIVEEISNQTELAREATDNFGIQFKYYERSIVFEMPEDK